MSDLIKHDGPAGKPLKYHAPAAAPEQSPRHERMHTLPAKLFTEAEVREKVARELEEAASHLVTMVNLTEVARVRQRAADIRSGKENLE